jgi:hypothetical protein
MQLEKSRGIKRVVHYKGPTVATRHIVITKANKSCGVRHKHSAIPANTRLKIEKH